MATLVFDPHWHLNRPALLLVNGTVYIGFGSHCDKHLGAFLAGSSATMPARYSGQACSRRHPILRRPARRPPRDLAGRNGTRGKPGRLRVLHEQGNGDLTAHQAGGRDFGDSVVKLKSDFTVADFFAPSDQPTLLARDIDLGSGGVLILPDPPAGTNGLPFARHVRQGRQRLPDQPQ